MSVEMNSILDFDGETSNISGCKATLLGVTWNFLQHTLVPYPCFLLCDWPSWSPRAPLPLCQRRDLKLRKDAGIQRGRQEMLGW